MLKIVKRFFSIEKKNANKKEKKGKNVWGEKQIKEMAKLGGKLILM